MKLGYTILYVEDVAKTLTFYEQAFGLKRKSLHEDDTGSFGELDTGNTTLAFTSHSMLRHHGINSSSPDSEAPCFQISLATDDVVATLKQAVLAGARLLLDVKEMPWGQIAYVADPEGFLVDISFERPPAVGASENPWTFFTILYVEDVAKTLKFYEQAFGLKQKSLSECGGFGELDTGNAVLAFASRRFIKDLVKNPSPPNSEAPCFEIALVTDDVAAALKHAVQSGACLVQDVEEMPWGQTTAYVADPNGFLVEICSPISEG